MKREKMLQFASLHRQFSLTIRILIAVGLFVLALVLHLLTLPIEIGMAYVTFSPAVILSFFFCGIRLGILTAILSGLSGMFIFTIPVWTIPANFYEFAGFTYFEISSFFSGFVITKLQRYEEQISGNLTSAIAELDQSNNILKMAKQAANAGIWHWNLQTKKMIWDDEMFKLLGIDKTEPTLGVWGKVLHPDDRQSAMTAVENSLENYVPFISSYRIILPNKQIRWIDAYGSTNFDSTGKLNEMVGIIIDSTNIHRAEHKIRVNEQRLRYIFEHLPIPYLAIESTGKCIETNYKMAEMLEIDNPAKIIGKNVFDFFNSDYTDRNKGIYAEFEQTYQLSGEYELITQQSKKITVIINCYLEKDENSRHIKSHLIMTNITERHEWELALEKLNNELEAKVLERTSQLKKANLKLEALAREDALTKQPNRLAMRERLHVEFLSFKRKKNPYAILMLDIDFFKHVNDTYGHAVGDDVLIKLAKKVKGLIREVDFLCRYGGEEFLILLPDTDLESASIVAEKIRKAVAATKHPVVGLSTLSIGVALVDILDIDEDAVVKRADEALYVAKKSGRNQVKSISEKIDQS